MRVTRPSAGETTMSGSDGGTRFGSRKKNAIKSATTKRNAATYQKPSTTAAIPNSAGTKIYGTLSLTMLKLFYVPFVPFVTNFFFVLLCGFYVKGDAYFWFTSPFDSLS